MIFYKKGNQTGSKGFTLIELLVVIAIIGILSAVVLASLNSARQKSRDAKRVADIRQMQLALELYFDDNTSRYPATLGDLVTQGYLPVIAQDPDGSAYDYAALGTGAACTSYHLGADIEGTPAALNNDSDASAGTICTGSAADFSGADPKYDLTP